MSPVAPRPQRPKPGTFDRIPPADAERKAKADPQGKQALFSAAEQPPSLGSASVDCTQCHRRTVVSLPQLLKLSATGVHAPLPKKGYKAWLKCPACGERSWMKVKLGR
ncbi:MAG: hypothetical protein KDC23_05835 [Actinobacteria bacterium]|nr:hypothetical protein [Actinomycetota bacterium]